MHPHLRKKNKEQDRYWYYRGCTILHKYTICTVEAIGVQVLGDTSWERGRLDNLLDVLFHSSAERHAAVQCFKSDAVHSGNGL